jgi:hypothetical protein
VAHGDHDPRPCVRERCAALEKIAAGMSPHAVAQRGLLRPRDPDTVYGRMAAYETGTAWGRPGVGTPLSLCGEA